MARQCKAITQSGERCSAFTKPDAEWCHWHHPDLQRERAEWRRKGGKGKATSARLRKLWESDQLTPAQLSGLLSGAMVSTLNGELDASILTALSGGARALIAVMQADQFEQRLSALERDRGRIA